MSSTDCTCIVQIGLQTAHSSDFEIICVDGEVHYLRYLLYIGTKYFNTLFNSHREIDQTILVSHQMNYGKDAVGHVGFVLLSSFLL